MDEQIKIQMKIISWLLQYPDEGFRQSLPLMETSLSHLPNSSARDKLVQFISYFQATPLLRLQETYTETFDINPSTCLNLTYHLLGDSEKRGKVMAGLQQIYLEAGYETIAGELPDYLPLMLEFLSECPESGGAGRIWSYLAAVEKPAGLLKDSGNPYSLLLDIVGDIVREEGRTTEGGDRRTEDRGRRTEDGDQRAGKKKVRWNKIKLQEQSDTFNHQSTFIYLKIKMIFDCQRPGCGS